MVLKVHGVLMSTCTRTVLVALKEKNVPYEFVAVDFYSGEHKKPEHLKYQPFGVVPYIVCYCVITPFRLCLSACHKLGRRWFHPLRESRYRSLYRNQICFPRDPFDPYRCPGQRSI